MKKTYSFSPAIAKVLMLGVYDINQHGRSRILWKGLKANNAIVELFLPTGKLRYFSIALRVLRRNYSIILVTGKIALLVAWLLKWWHRKPVVFDVFISDYDTLVLDRKLVKQDSLKAKMLWWADKLCCMIADKCFLDTKAHAEFFSQTFGLSQEKFGIVYVGADEDIFKCRKNILKVTAAKVHFHGTFIPLQGVDVIVRTAKILESENVVFTLIGKGQTYEECRALAEALDAKNIVWDEQISPAHVASKIAGATICLGIFSATGKAFRVIPHKAFEAIAACKPLITADTPAAREVFAHKKNAWLVQPNSPEALANAILTLAKNHALRKRIAKNGYYLFKRVYSTKSIGVMLFEVLNDAI